MKRATVPTSIKLDAKLKERIEAAAKAAGVTPHAFMIEALERQTRRDAEYRAFLEEGREADEEMSRTGQGYEAEDVFRYMEALASGNANAKRPPLKQLFEPEGKYPPVLARVLAHDAPVPKLAFSARYLDDIARILSFYAAIDPAVAKAQVRAIAEALSMLERHPWIGRPTTEGRRELVISQGKTGFVALYRFDVRRDRVRILRVRHQREIGFE